MQNGIYNRRDAETQSFNELTERVIGACIEIHRALGPGLLESAYEECLCHELSIAGIAFERQKPLPVHYKNVKLDCGYRLDLVVERKVIIELKTVEGLLPIHEAQLLTYLKLSGLTLGLLINFNVPMLKSGIKRIVNNFSESSASPRLGGEINFG
jgi:GxxExxY protein